ncbi:prolyl-tRNA synthetase [Fistulifera solaris]|uniref:proline--tRNA ligase n=1 Tax=Fistulifera solaris TaxID=1519565 RepID=A0A1Z5KMS2_FISSO|nr:prolyl-tRNA synthetase [Fistulifera solaris]|eukprot:GAX27238.1 prolyl-tRNA synthetase [Fistulifera solaris]
MQTTTFVGQASGIDATLIQIVAQLTNADLTFKEEGNKCSLVQTVKHSFTDVSQEFSAVGLSGAVRLLLKGNSALLGSTPAQQAAVDSWIESVDQTLLPVLRQEKTEPLFVAAVEDFLMEIEKHLFQNHKTVLVGDVATAADAVTAVAVAGVCHTVQVKELPQQAHRWCKTVLDKLQACLSDEALKVTLRGWADALTEGTASPLEMPLPVAASAPATPVVAVDENNTVLKKLMDMAIEHTAYSHDSCNTAEELVSKVPLPDRTHTHTKNLFLRDKKHGLFLVTVRPTANVNTKNLGHDLKLAGKTNLRMADAAVLDELLRVKPGSVGPLCVIQDGVNVKKANDEVSADKITLVMDKALFDNYSFVHSHPLRNDMSVQMTPQAMKDALQNVGVEPVLLEFAEVDPNAPAPSKEPKAQQEPKAKKEVADKKTAKKGETLLALQWKKTENFPNWYTDVIVLSEMISYYDISGCYILRPWSYKMWELIQLWFNERIQEDLGVENTYFPMFVSKSRLEKEKDHVEGFAPEVAWVTKSGDGDLENPIAIRPTSETIMYPAYSDWIRSHRDLPLKLNQWANVVRWEFKYPTPFLRTREFLWQEGHTAHATFEDAEKMVMDALELYRQVYEDLLAVPVIPGYKTEAEKFAGGYRTTTVEAYIAGSGRAIQGATSHHLGQNFGKMFDITFQDDKGETQTAWQTSWGLTTRTLGVMVMVHGDDTGLVLPPRVAPLQVVIVAIISKHLSAADAAPYCEAIRADLKACGIRVKYDDRDLYNPGWKYNHWEQKGVPIRVEVGPRDIENKSARVVVRHNGEKVDFPIEGLGARLKAKLDEIQSAMFIKAKEARDAHVVKVTEWKDFVPNLEKHNLVLTPWCGGEHQDWEDWVKKTSREESLKTLGQDGEDEKTATSVAAKTLCIPFNQPELPEGTMCIASGKVATCWVLWGRSY